MANALDRLKTTVGSQPSYNIGNTDQNTAINYIGNIINVFLGLLGVIFVVLIVYAGYNWMTASGKEEKVEKAQDIIKAAIYGLIITAGVYAIWQFVFVRLLS